MRDIIVHYHLFKNAGSSIDRLLKDSFGKEWISYDLPDPGGHISSNFLKQILDDNPTIRAFSSHQIGPPIPNSDLNIFPIVFIRHPIDRVKSAYLFEWGKQIGLDSPKGTFQEYITAKLMHVRRSVIEEFQTMRLANNDPNNPVASHGMDDEKLLGAAKRFLREAKFFGIVEEFERSVRYLEALLRPTFPNFRVSSVKANVLQNNRTPIPDRLLGIRDELGEFYETLLTRNKLDLELYEYAVDQFHSRLASVNS